MLYFLFYSMVEAGSMLMQRGDIRKRIFGAGVGDRTSERERGGGGGQEGRGTYRIYCLREKGF